MTQAIDTKAPLEDLMVAMDVVDTLRHQRGVAERELDGEARRERLLDRLKELYKAQGIEVPEHVLLEGIDALEQERFKYQPVQPSWRTKIAKIWVSRKRWKKPLGILTLLGGLFGGVHFFYDVLPERELRAELPQTLSASLHSISDIAKNPTIVNLSKTKVAIANQALAADNLDKAQKIQIELDAMQKTLQEYYAIRIVARSGESSGVWRVPDVNETTRNYYLIVEAIGNGNKVVELEILSEETNETRLAKSWGIRVDEETFYKVAADKSDDGIIQRNLVGEKPIGYLQPKFSIQTTGGKITEW